MHPASPPVGFEPLIDHSSLSMQQLSTDILPSSFPKQKQPNSKKLICHLCTQHHLHWGLNPWCSSWYITLRFVPLNESSPIMSDSAPSTISRGDISPCTAYYTFRQRWMVSSISGFVQVRLRTEVLRTPSSTWAGFELMTSRSWQFISCHWGACCSRLAISIYILLKWVLCTVPN